ncbi:GGDEF domain-containing protein [Sphingomonas sp.]|uniref:GGDEF domain-containing protein n=1 Tax=Sphingomonas sp. TaxID=28214 RepID=UPI0031D9AAD8
MMKLSPRVSPDVYKALTVDLAYSALPTTIMGATLIVVAIVAGGYDGDPILILTACCGGAAAIGKLALMGWQRRLARVDGIDLAEARRFQVRHSVATLVMAATVAGTASRMFLHPRVEWHVLAAALLFAYGSGVVGRLSILPALALPALVTAAVPVIAACATWGDTAHRLTALMFAIFLFGSFETVRYIHRRAVRHIATELDMATLARNDPMTGLANRLGFREAFRTKALHPTGPLALHCLDLDGFKGVNDRLGHAAGDALLVEVARRLVTAASGSTVARLGGDEFAILQHGIGHVDDAKAVADAVIAGLREPFEIAGTTVRIGASLGFTVAAPATADFDAMLRTADAASYRIKRAGGGAAMSRPDDGFPDDGVTDKAA